MNGWDEHKKFQTVWSRKVTSWSRWVWRKVTRFFFLFRQKCSPFSFHIVFIRPSWFKEQSWRQLQSFRWQFLLVWSTVFWASTKLLIFWKLPATSLSSLSEHFFRLNLSLQPFSFKNGLKLWTFTWRVLRKLLTFYLIKAFGRQSSQFFTMNFATESTPSATLSPFNWFLFSA